MHVLLIAIGVIVMIYGAGIITFWLNYLLLGDAAASAAVWADWRSLLFHGAVPLVIGFALWRFGRRLDRTTWQRTP